MKYTVESNGFGGCGHMHRSRETAERCLDALRERYARLPGGNSWYPGYVAPADEEAERADTRARAYELLERLTDARMEQEAILEDAEFALRGSQPRRVRDEVEYRQQAGETREQALRAIMESAQRRIDSLRAEARRVSASLSN